MLHKNAAVRCQGAEPWRCKTGVRRAVHGGSASGALGTVLRAPADLPDGAWRGVGAGSAGRILEADFEVVLLSAKHIKNVPGRKTDVQDCRWLAQLLQHGLVRGSFIPPRPIRELRDLTRGRRRLVAERTSVVNRVHKVLEDANIKLASVATDVMGKSGWNMVGAIIDGDQDPQALAALARGRLQAKREQLEQALHGRVTDHHRLLLAQHRTHIEFLDPDDRRLRSAHRRAGEAVFALIPLLYRVPVFNEVTRQGDHRRDRC